MLSDCERRISAMENEVAELKRQLGRPQIQYATTGLWKESDSGINRVPIDELLTLMDSVHEHLTDPVFLDKEETRDNLLRIQNLCGNVARNIDFVLRDSYRTTKCDVPSSMPGC